jgi:TolA-binding protein
MQSGDYVDAIEELRQFIRVTNNQQLLPDEYFSLANAYEQTGQMDQAVETYRRVANQYPGSERAAPALAAIGRIAYARGNYQASFNAFKEMLEKGAGLTLEARIGMGNASLAMDNLQEARNHFEAVLAQDGNYAPASVGLGKIALKNQNYSRAENLISQVARSNTTEVGAEAQYLLGVVKQRQQQFDQALSAYSNVSVLYEAYDEWVAKALLNSAECHIQLGNTGEARSVLSSLVEKYPDRPEAREAQKMLQSE